MGPCEGYVRLHVFLMSALDEGDWSVFVQADLSLRKSFRYRLNRKLDGAPEPVRKLW